MCTKSLKTKMAKPIPERFSNGFHRFPKDSRNISRWHPPTPEGFLKHLRGPPPTPEGFSKHFKNLKWATTDSRRKHLKGSSTDARKNLETSHGEGGSTDSRKILETSQVKASTKFPKDSRSISGGLHRLPKGSRGTHTDTPTHPTRNQETHKRRPRALTEPSKTVAKHRCSEDVSLLTFPDSGLVAHLS